MPSSPLYALTSGGGLTSTSAVNANGAPSAGSSDQSMVGRSIGSIPAAATAREYQAGEVIAQSLLDHGVAADLPHHERLGRLALAKTGHADGAGEVAQRVVERVVDVACGDLDVEADTVVGEFGDLGLHAKRRRGPSPRSRSLTLVAQPPVCHRRDLAEGAALEDVDGVVGVAGDDGATGAGEDGPLPIAGELATAPEVRIAGGPGRDLTAGGREVET